MPDQTTDLFSRGAADYAERELLLRCKLNRIAPDRRLRSQPFQAFEKLFLDPDLGAADAIQSAVTAILVAITDSKER